MDFASVVRVGFMGVGGWHKYKTFMAKE